MKKLLFRLIVEVDGPTAVEYGVMLALIVATCIAAVNTLASSTAASYDSSAAELQGVLSS